MTDTSQTTVPWRGFHHVAITTPDLEATIRFYVDILGMQVGAIIERRERHCFIKPGDSESFGLHVFETSEAQIFPYPSSSERFVFIPGVLQHIAFALPDEASALTLRDRLHQHNIETTGINTLGPFRNFLFVDNNGTLLEATWPNTESQA